MGRRRGRGYQVDAGRPTNTNGLEVQVAKRIKDDAVADKSDDNNNNNKASGSVSGGFPSRGARRSRPRPREEVRGMRRDLAAENDGLLGDEGEGNEGSKRLRKKRRLGRKCSGMCHAPPPIPNALLKRDADERQKKKNLKNKRKKKEKKQKEFERKQKKQNGGAHDGVRVEKVRDGDTSLSNRKDKPSSSTAGAAGAAGASSSSSSLHVQPSHGVDYPQAHLVLLSYLEDRLGIKDGGCKHEPTEIQRQCWPVCLEGHDVQARAEPGTGKTFGYMFPILYLLNHKRQTKADAQGMEREEEVEEEEEVKARALVLAPTRELAKQILATCRDLRHLTGQRGLAVTGGIAKDEQLDAMKTQQHSVIVATPGRLCDLIDHKQVDLSQVEFLVIDEADKMLQMGFDEQLQKIQEQLRKGEGRRSSMQTLLFSATFPRQLQKRCKLWLRNEKMIDVQTELHMPAVSQNIKQVVQVCAEHKKGRKLLKYLQSVRTDAKEEGVRHVPKILIFVNTIKKCRNLFGFLKKNEERSVMIHGKRNQKERVGAMQDFKSGKVNTLVATDIAGRGIHIPGLRHVVLYDFPPSLEQYAHRIGRTGRQQETGEAVAYFTRNLAPMAPDLVKLLREHKQHVDPHLLVVAEAAEEAAKRKKKEEELKEQNEIQKNK